MIQYCLRSQRIRVSCPLVSSCFTSIRFNYSQHPKCCIAAPLSLIFSNFHILRCWTGKIYRLALWVMFDMSSLDWTKAFAKYE